MIALALVAAEIAGVAVPVPGADGCPPDRGGEIVVCHRAIETDRYRLRQRLPDAPVEALPRAEWGLGGGVRMGIEGEAATIAPGVVSNRAMVRLKIPF